MARVPDHNTVLEKLVEKYLIENNIEFSNLLAGALADRGTLTHQRMDDKRKTTFVFDDEHVFTLTTTSSWQELYTNFPF